MCATLTGGGDQASRRNVQKKSFNTLHPGRSAGRYFTISIEQLLQVDELTPDDKPADRANQPQADGANLDARPLGSHSRKPVTSLIVAACLINGEPLTPSAPSSSIFLCLLIAHAARTGCLSSPDRLTCVSQPGQREFPGNADLCVTTPSTGAVIVA